ncbi:MAG TPA: phosphodiester glycosidase family protein [Vicinamibacterales bacterium]|nr:phosphodiester glycosidase family protein [Vicinamibacterales bacterium]
MRAVAILLALQFACAKPAPQKSWLGDPTTIAPGVDFYQSTDSTLLETGGRIAVYLLRLDPARVQLVSALSNDEVVDAERVAGIATRHQAVAAINGGFFNVKNGEPTGLLKVRGELVSDTSLGRGAVVIRSPPTGKTELFFDQISAKVTMKFRAEGFDWVVPIDGVDTTRERGKVMLYTPAYHGDTDTASKGTEWIIRGSKKPVVTEIRKDAGRTPIPRDGAVLSFGGLELPDELGALDVGTAVTFETTWTAANGLPTARLEQADHIVNGAGLLRVNGVTPSNWQTHERLVPDTFINARHPRTVIGVDRAGFIWLIAIDGRQADHSAGMHFADLQRLCDRLNLRDALNLDGGGSTTMVVQGKIVNRPSDAAGPRAVSDAILVKMR